MNTIVSDLFEEDLDLPDPLTQQRYAGLLGLDHVKTRLAKEAELILAPGLLADWSRRCHGRVLPAVARLAHRPRSWCSPATSAPARPRWPRPSPTRSRAATTSTCGSSA
jgi:hypothetical protein